MYYYNRKKQMIKSVLMIVFILLVAIFATHHIYYKFKNQRNVDYSSKSLEVTFHEKSGDNILLTRITPVTDSVGLSSKSYTFTIKNNLTEKVPYKVSLIKNIKAIIKDNCGEYQIPESIIKVSYKKDKEDTKIVILSDLKDGIIEDTKIKPLAEEEYTIMR